MIHVDAVSVIKHTHTSEKRKIGGVDIDRSLTERSVRAQRRRVARWPREPPRANRSTAGHAVARRMDRTPVARGSGPARGGSARGARRRVLPPALPASRDGHRWGGGRFSSSPPARSSPRRRPICRPAHRPRRHRLRSAQPPRRAFGSTMMGLPTGRAGTSTRRRPLTAPGAVPRSARRRTSASDGRMIG